MPDALVVIADIREASHLPSWLHGLSGTPKSGDKTLFAWHYGFDDKLQSGLSFQNINVVSNEWNVPVFGTETGFTSFHAVAIMNISRSYWYYNQYYTEGNSKYDSDSMLGWKGGNSTCPSKGWSYQYSPYKCSHKTYKIGIVVVITIVVAVVVVPSVYLYVQSKSSMYL